MNISQEEHFVGKVTQKVLLVKDATVLITRDSRDEVWELPGGRLNAGENPKEGVVREVQEELGVEVDIKEVVYINQFTHSADNSLALVVVYVAHMKDVQQEFVVDPIEVAQMQWVDSTTWSEYKYYPEYKSALETYFKSIG